jgi:DNA polymerase II small subunit
LSERLQKAISNTIEAGYQLDQEAFGFLETLSKTEDPIKFMEIVIKKTETLAQKPLFINRSLLEETATEQVKAKPENELTPTFPALPSAQTTHPQFMFEARKEAFKPYAKEIEAQIRVLNDPTATVSTDGTLEGYVEYFQDRFKQLQRLLRQRFDVRDATTIAQVLQAKPNAKLKVIGMITERREAKQRTFIQIEDLEAKATVLVPSNLEKSIQERVQALLLDQVVCISVIKGRDDLLILEDVYLPEIPQRNPRKAIEPVHAVLTSDLHVGSKKFMRETFHRFLLWLNGKTGNPRLRALASHVKYVVIAGDLVDGVGIYPGQARELAFKDVHRQYSLVAKYLEHIPDYIEVIVIPGNHDASRKALPQPAIPKEYGEPMYESRKINSLGNPSEISMHGVEFLLYHGRSIDDVVSIVPDMTHSTPDKAMKLLLRCRHLAPIYGQRTPIAPAKRDFMVIERVPDVFHAGHVHVVKIDAYRGTTIVNSGAWQEQTEYMKQMGFMPVPGIAPIINLQTMQLSTIDFTNNEGWT